MEKLHNKHLACITGTQQLFIALSATQNFPLSSSALEAPLNIKIDVEHIVK